MGKHWSGDREQKDYTSKNLSLGFLWEKQAGQGAQAQNELLGIIAMGPGCEG